MTMNNSEPLTLFSLNSLVRRAVEQSLPERYWVVGEISELRETAAGHCYMELVQRDEVTGELIAKARGTVWQRIYSLLLPYFYEETGSRLVPGMNVLLQVKPSFHEQYGYNLEVCDIEPSYTVGETARRRRLVINRLEKEGVINLNKELEMPLLPQRIAVISSSHAAGYGDFCDQLARNKYGFDFCTHLFPAPMQGNGVEQGIISALDSIAENIELWDAVVIIRGGGATSDLSCFDTYNLANNCAQFPLPIITGIGHHRDDTVLDSVSHTCVKTPTAAAEFLIHAVAQQAANLDMLKQGIAEGVKVMLLNMQQRLQVTVQRLPVVTALFVQQHYHKLDLWQQQIEAASPQRILSLGYTLTTCNGKVLRSVDQVGKGDVIVTQMQGGTITSIVNKFDKNE